MGLAEDFDPTTYWEYRYAHAGTSGSGSRGDNAKAKAHEINQLIRRHKIETIVDWGCGDGYLTERLIVGDYMGVDVSRTAVGIGLLRFGEHQFLKWNPTSGINIEVTAELALSVDVIFHLTDDMVKPYVEKVFGSATRIVVVYAPDEEIEVEAPHVKFRPWTHLVPDGWDRRGRPPGGAGPWVFSR